MSAVAPDFDQLSQIRSYDGMGLSPYIVADQYDLSVDEVRNIWNGTYRTDGPVDARSDLSPLDAQLILGARGRVSPADLARRFRCSSATINNIWAGDSWQRMKRGKEDNIGSKVQTARMIALMLEGAKRPHELASELKVSLNTIHRNITAMRNAGYDVRAKSGEKENERYYYIANMKLIRPLTDRVVNAPRRKVRESVN